MTEVENQKARELELTGGKDDPRLVNHSRPRVWAVFLGRAGLCGDMKGERR